MDAAPERLQTEDFVVRGWREDDGPALWEAIAGSREHLRHMPWTRHYDSERDATAYVRRSRARYLLKADFDLAIFDADESRVLGGTGFHLHDEPFEPAKQAEIGMWIRADRAHIGIGTAVLRRLITWGFEEWGFMRLSWHCNTNNRASRRCAEKAGMLPEGTLRGEYDLASGGRRDTSCYGLCFLDFMARREP